MKILYFFPEYDTPMFSWQRVHFIDELERHNVEFELFNPLLFDSPNAANERFIIKMREGKYDLLMSSVCYPGMIYPDVLSTAKQLGLPSLSIRWDNLTIPFFDKHQAAKFDLLWLTAFETEYLYKKWGVNYIIQPYAANPYSFIYNDRPLVRKACFIGTPYGSRSLMLNKLTNNRVHVDVYSGGVAKQKSSSGIKYKMVTPSRFEIIKDRLRFSEGRRIMWGMVLNKCSRHSRIDRNEFVGFHPGVAPDEMCSRYSEYSISLASTSCNHTDVLKKPLKIINLRNFEIPMSGGIELCKFNKELAGYYEDGKEILFYNSDEELVDKAKYYCYDAPEKEVLKIKDAARKRSERDHTWWNRFSKVFATLGLKYE